MRARAILEEVIRQGKSELREVTIRRPPRSRNWLAIFTSAESGMSTARSTGTANKRLATRRARAWEREARQERELRRQTHGPAERRVGAELTQREIALILGLSERAVRSIEKRAILKLRKHPIVRELLGESAQLKGSVPPVVVEARTGLSQEEVEALLGLTRTAYERWALERVLSVVQRAG